MRKQKEETVLSEVIKASRIYAAIEDLENALKSYQRIHLIQEEAYTIQLDFIDVQTEIDHLRRQLNTIIDHSNIWEAQ